jgi:uncharacterized protein YdaU (DUF1376 family)
VNYYEHHLGDWAAATGHLTWDEDMAYTRLLRAYYHSEKAIPEGQQYRLAKASTPAQRKAVDAVLAEFFTLREGAHHQARAEREIERFRDKQSKAKASANARWTNAERNPKAMRTHEKTDANALPMQCEGNAPNHQAPNTRHQKDNTGSDDPVLSLGAGPEPNGQPAGQTPTPTPTPAAAVCMALKSHGIGKVSPQNQRLLMLLAAGAEVGEFVGFAAKALETAPGAAFEYVLGAVEGERKRAALTAGKLHRGGLPNKQQALEARNRAVGAEWLQQQREKVQ